MDQSIVSDKTDDFSEVPFIQAAVHNFQPNYTAQSGGNVVAPSIIGSNVGNININIFSATQECKEDLNNDHTDSCGALPPEIDKVAECQQNLKATLRRKFSHILEGLATETNKISLNNIYTELYVTEGGSGEVNKEHEVRQIETTPRIHVGQEKSIHCNHLFAPLPERGCDIRTVVTRGVAGIGKTVLTNKFTLDWAEERANKNLEFVFPLSFRELNLMKKKNFSLVELLVVLFPEIKDIEIFTNVKKNMLFILDGLDESRLSLDFNKCEILSDVTQTTTIAVLMTNLIRGRLLPMALVWITSRPVASSQIPANCVDLVTEVRGFNNLQKDEYFRRKISDENLANRVIAHVKTCRSLHIMCHIPIFCWMAATVFEKNMATKESKDTPKTLTQMYIHFLSLCEEAMKKRLTGRRESNADCVRANLLALGKLAFQELEKGHLIFNESDLKLNGIDTEQASMFSGVYTQIFHEEMTVCKEKMFCFVHLSVQEFFAALYVFLTFHNDNVNVLVKLSASRRFLSRSSELILYKEAVEKALRSEKGDFDMFLRFLLGLSLESNQTLLKHLMINNRTQQKTRTEIVKHIKEKIRSSPSPDRCLNLFHCLNELNDHSLVEEIQSYLSSGSLNRANLSPAQWATLVFVLLTSEEEQSVFELGNYTRSEEGLLRLLPVVKTAQVANLNACNLTLACCENLANAISSSQLRELDLSNNNLTDAGLMKLSSGLRNSKVETLSLSLCGVGEEGCIFLASALNSCHLRELDMSYNHPGNSGLNLLTALKEDPQCTLVKLSIDQCGEFRIQPSPKKYTIKLTLDPNTAHKDLSLSEENRKATRWTKQPYPDHPERFDYWTQVLCREGLKGRYYWETEWTGRVFIGVAYRRISRKGETDDCWLGRNNSSWGLNCNKDGYKALHKGTSIPITTKPNSNKVGVFLDWSAGTLSFYMLSCDSLKLLHTFHTTFDKPVYPGFHLAWVDSKVYLC
uniref:NACHT, LRR and PYD domains-containing protein 3 n=1 Tax=Oreochromis niloticus TaxID=8128 RepID=I3KFR3_ORENI